MGRVKLQIKKIENTQNRHVTFSKRRNGLIKKAYELAILCDVDIALVMFSPSGRLCHFSGKTRLSRIEDVLSRFLNLREDEGASENQNREYLLTIVEKLRTEHDMALQASKPENAEPTIEEGQLAIGNMQHQLQLVGEQIRKFEPENVQLMTLEEAEKCETELSEVLQGLHQRKNYLLKSQVSYTPPNVKGFLGNQEGLPSYGKETPAWMATQPQKAGVLESSVEGGKNLAMFEPSDRLSLWNQGNQANFFNNLLPTSGYPNLREQKGEGPSFTSMLQLDDYRSNDKPTETSPRNFIKEAKS